jgi:hypothetical protein
VKKATFGLAEGSGSSSAGQHARYFIKRTPPAEL